MTTITTNPLEEGYDFYIADKWNKEYHFKILTFEVPVGLISVAVEKAEETVTYLPRKFEVLSDFNADIERAELLLKAKIKKDINRKSLKLSDTNRFEIVNDTLRGEIIAEPYLGTIDEHIFAIDGKKISIRQLYKMLEPYYSFRFKFEIKDPSEDNI